MISVIIATKNRSKDLHRLLLSLSKNSLSPLEVLVADQSDKPDKEIKQFKKSLRGLRYYHLASSGKTKALTSMVPKTRGKIVAFTDDDCVVSRSWLLTINRALESNPHVSAVFGSTFPYQPKNHKSQVCLSVFRTKKTYNVLQPKLHYRHIGFGNNMAIRKQVFSELGSFKDWLGPGSLGSNAEDAEIALRMLVLKRQILHDGHMIVYHNKWLTPKETRQQVLSYTCGEMACYSYYYFQGYSFAASVVKSNARNSFKQLKFESKNILSRPLNTRQLARFIDVLITITYQLRGLLVGLAFSRMDPLNSLSEASL